MAEDNDILGDHRWKRTKLVPPMMDALGPSLSPIRWEYEIVPEIIWIGELLKNCGGTRVVELVRNCAEASEDLFGEPYVLLDDYYQLSDTGISELHENLDNTVLADLSSNLQTLSNVYPRMPIGRAADIDPKEPDDPDLSAIASTIDELSTKRGPLAMKAQGVWFGVLMVTGKVVIPKDIDFGDINEIFRYPDTEESKKVASAVRAGINAIQGTRGEDRDSRLSGWALSFWERGFEVTDCIYPHELEEQEEKDDEGVEELDSDFFDDMVAIGFEFEESLKKTILDLWLDAPHDPEFTGKNEVLDGLLMRQVNLAANMAISPSLWTADTAGMILRSMAETQITLEWFNQNGSRESYQDFIEYGLGQQKLMLEHHRRMLASVGSGDTDSLEEGFDRMEQQLESQRYMYLLPVDVGHWADKNTRQLAEEADCKQGLYDLRFQQHNPAVHGSWDFLYQNHLVECQNPLHQYHRIPYFEPLPKIPFAVVEAGNMMERSLSSWLEARNIDAEFEVFDLAESVRGYLRESGKFDDQPGLG